jgi:Glycosyltransferase sugar-binding region containing DXD motif
MAMRLGLNCYDFAGTIHPLLLASDQPSTNYHTYWCNDLVPFSKQQEYMLKSFFAMQDPHLRLIMWSNGDLSTNVLLVSYVIWYPGRFELHVTNMHKLSVGMPLEDSSLLSSTDWKAWLDGDLVRLLVVWKEGGVWVDMGTLLTCNISPLLEQSSATRLPIPYRQASHRCPL